MVLGILLVFISARFIYPLRAAVWDSGFVAGLLFCENKIISGWQDLRIIVSKRI